ncbi:MAG: helix-turn-helix domain-containing protein [Thermodesulfobacteriota bacterium]|nr:helix-turn-helix domain-containing protein [Thermodesulfobacteriota bacterium]
MEHVETLAVDINGVCGILRDRPDFTIRMFQYIAGWQKVYLNSIKNLAICCPKERLLNYFNYLAEQEHSRSFKFPVPKGEIALLLGITPETFSRMLRKLVDENIIHIKGKEIHLLRQRDNFRDSGKFINNCGFGLDTGIHRFGASING